MSARRGGEKPVMVSAEYSGLAVEQPHETVCEDVAGS